MTPLPEPELAAPGVLLRPWRPEDVEAVYRACQDPQIQRWTSVPSPYLPEDAERFVGESRQRWTDGTPSFAALDPASGELLGSIGFIRAPADGVSEVGYWVAEPARGRGIAQSMVRLICRWGFDSLGLERIEWRAQVGNVASRLVAEACGFRVEGRLRHALLGESGMADAWVGGLLAGDPTTRARQRLIPAQPVDVAGGDPLVTLRGASVSDSNWALSAYLDPLTVLWNPSDVTDLASAEEWTRRRADWTDDNHASWVVTTHGYGVAVGSVSLHKVDTENLTASLGYWTHPSSRGQGYASSAVRLAAAWGLGRLDLQRIEILHAVDNVASCRVAERAGFELEATVCRAQRYGDGKWHDEHIHARFHP